MTVPPTTRTNSDAAASECGRSPVHLRVGCGALGVGQRIQAARRHLNGLPQDASATLAEDSGGETPPERPAARCVSHVGRGFRRRDAT